MLPWVSPTPALIPPSLLVSTALPSISCRAIWVVVGYDSVLSFALLSSTSVSHHNLIIYSCRLLSQTPRAGPSVSQMINCPGNLSAWSPAQPSLIFVLLSLLSSSSLTPVLYISIVIIW